MDIMVNGVHFQAQLTSIMEMLAKAAVAEIGKLVDECSTVLHLEISRRVSENESLKKKCDFLETELRTARSARRTVARKTPVNRPNDGDFRAVEDRHPPAIDGVFGKEWCMNLWRDGEPNTEERDDTQQDSAIIRDESIDLVDDEPDMILIKEETFEDCFGKRNLGRGPRNNKKSKAAAISGNDIGERASNAPQNCEEDFITYSIPSDDQEEQNTQHRQAEHLIEDSTPATPSQNTAESNLDSEAYAGFYPGNVSFNTAQNQRAGMGEKKFDCMFCGKSFSYLSYLKVHVRRHSGEKPFACTVCGKTFAQKTYLKLHERTHSGEKPYTCMECGKSFSQKSSLNVHLRSHTGEKPYSCLECGKSYAYKHGFNTHQCVS